MALRKMEDSKRPRVRKQDGRDSERTGRSNGITDKDGGENKGGNGEYRVGLQQGRKCVLKCMQRLTVVTNQWATTTMSPQCNNYYVDEAIRIKNN